MKASGSLLGTAASAAVGSRFKGKIPRTIGGVAAAGLGLNAIRKWIHARRSNKKSGKLLEKLTPRQKTIAKKYYGYRESV